MNLLKIELDLPEFEKEVNINITIKRDGEVVYSATSSPSNCGDIEGKDTKVEVEAPKSSEVKVSKRSTKTKISNSANGNFMNLDL